MSCTHIPWLYASTIQHTNPCPKLIFKNRSLNSRFFQNVKKKESSHSPVSFIDFGEEPNTMADPEALAVDLEIKSLLSSHITYQVFKQWLDNVDDVGGCMGSISYKVNTLELLSDEVSKEYKLDFITTLREKDLNSLANKLMDTFTKKKGTALVGILLINIAPFISNNLQSKLNNYLSWLTLLPYMLSCTHETCITAYNAPNTPCLTPRSQLLILIQMLISLL
jgi:hypothetical protein